MKRILLFSLMLFSLSSLLYAATPEDILERDRKKQQEIKMKDQEHQRKILEKYQEFFNRVMKFAPELKLAPPVHPGYVDNIKDNTHPSKFKKTKKSYAYVAESYFLRALPDDRNKTYVGKVKRNTRVEVLMKPTTDYIPKGGSFTREWRLVKLKSGEEGFIPLDLLSSKRIAKKKIRRGDNPLYRIMPLAGLLKSGGKHLLKQFDVSVSIEQSGGDQSFHVIMAGYGESGSDSSGLKKMVVSADVLNIRSDETLESQKIGSAYRGDIVEILKKGSRDVEIDGIKAPWAYIKHRHLKGWVFSGYLKDSVVAEPEKIDDFRKGDSFYVKSELLRLRDAPGEEGTVITSLPHQSKVKILNVIDELKSIGGNKSKWVEIACDEYSGWVFGAFLSKNKNAFMEDDDIDRMFIFPFSNTSLPITSRFGPRVLKGKSEKHKGIDIGARSGTPILSAADGKVMLAIENPPNLKSGYGRYVVLEHKNGYRTLYGHMSVVKTREGQRVNAGDVIGLVGTTGRCYGAHLHFEIRAHEEYVNPETYLHACLIILDSLIAALD